MRAGEHCRAKAEPIHIGVGLKPGSAWRQGIASPSQSHSALRPFREHIRRRDGQPPPHSLLMPSAKATRIRIHQAPQSIWPACGKTSSRARTRAAICARGEIVSRYCSNHASRPTRVNPVNSYLLQNMACKFLILESAANSKGRASALFGCAHHFSNTFDPNLLAALVRRRQ
jgi:hypothetical protein